MSPDPDDDRLVESELLAPVDHPMPLERAVATFKGPVHPRVDRLDQLAPLAGDALAAARRPAASEPSRVTPLPRQQRDLGQIRELITSPDWQRRLDEARAQREKVGSSARPAPPDMPVPRRDDDPVQRAVAPGRQPAESTSAAKMPAPAVVQFPFRMVEGSKPFSPELLASSLEARAPKRVPYWTLGLIGGLIAGMALGAGVTGLASYDPQRVLGAAGEGATTPADRNTASNGSEAGTGPTVSDAAPLDPNLEGAGADVAVRPFAADRNLARVEMEPLGATAPADGPVAVTSSGPSVGGGQWQAPPTLGLAHEGNGASTAIGASADGQTRVSAVSPLAAPALDQAPARRPDQLGDASRLGVVNAVLTSAATPPEAQEPARFGFSPDLAEAALRLPPRIPPAILALPDDLTSGGQVFAAASARPAVEPATGRPAGTSKLPLGASPATFYEGSSEFRIPDPAALCVTASVPGLTENEAPFLLECDQAETVSSMGSSDPDDRSSGNGRSRDQVGGNGEQAGGDPSDGAGTGGGTPTGNTGGGTAPDGPTGGSTGGGSGGIDAGGSPGSAGGASGGGSEAPAPGDAPGGASGGEPPGGSTDGGQGGSDPTDGSQGGAGGSGAPGGDGGSSGSPGPGDGSAGGGGSGTGGDVGSGGAPDGGSSGSGGSGGGSSDIGGSDDDSDGSGSGQDDDEDEDDSPHDDRDDDDSPRGGRDDDDRRGGNGGGNGRGRGKDRD